MLGRVIGISLFLHYPYSWPLVNYAYNKNYSNTNWNKLLNVIYIEHNSVLLLKTVFSYLHSNGVHVAYCCLYSPSLPSSYKLYVLNKEQIFIVDVLLVIIFNSISYVSNTNIITVIIIINGNSHYIIVHTRVSYKGYSGRRWSERCPRK